MSRVVLKDVESEFFRVVTKEDVFDNMDGSLPQNKRYRDLKRALEVAKDMNGSVVKIKRKTLETIEFERTG